MKKILLFIGMLICFISTNVFASSLSKEETNYYFTRYFSDHSYSEKLYLYKIDGNVVYCVEPGVSPGTTDYYPTAIDYLNLPSNVLENITYYAYFGYDYPGHQNIKYYAAAQALMWEEILGLVSPTTISSEPFNQGTQLSITKEKNEIISLIGQYKKIPSFTYSEYQYLVGDECELIDGYNTLSYFNFDNTVRVDQDKLKFKFDDISTHTINFTRKKIYNNSYELYYSKDHQDMLRAGEIDSKHYWVNIKTRMFDMMFDKIDENGKPLKGAIFDFYDSNDNLLATVESKENGRVEPGYIFRYGNYYAIEREAPLGYQRSDEIHRFAITQRNHGYRLTIINKKIKNVYKFTKYLRDKDGNKVIEEGAKFNLLDEEGNILGEYVSDSKGEFILDLTYGKYKLVQTYGMEGYKYIDDYLIEVTEIKNDLEVELFDDEIIPEKNEEPEETIDIKEDIEDTYEEEIIEIGDDEEILLLEDVPYTYKDEVCLSGMFLIITGFMFYILEVKNEE